MFAARKGIKGTKMGYQTVLTIGITIKHKHYGCVKPKRLIKLNNLKCAAFYTTGLLIKILTMASDS